MRKIEKLKFISDTGAEILFTPSKTLSSYWWNNADGLDGIDNNISTVKGSGQDGESVTDKNLPARHITVEGQICNDVTVARRRLLSVVNPKYSGRLEYTDGDIQRRIACEIQKAPIISRDGVFPEFQIEFYCPNPFWQDITTSKTDVSTENPSFSFPLEIPETGLELSIRTISFITNIYNPGDVATPIKVHLKATATVENPIITNLSTGEYILIKRQFAKGETLEINTEFGNKRVEAVSENGDRTNVFHYIDYNSSFFLIAPGDTQLSYDAEVGNNNLDVSIYYTPRYLGV